MRHFFSHMNKDRHNSRETSAQAMRQTAASITKDIRRIQARAKRDIPTIRMTTARSVGREDG